MVNFWNSKRVLITGHTGFKGTWLSIWLKKLGANVCGVSLNPNSNPNLYELSNINSFLSNHICDVRDYDNLSKICINFRPEIVFHLAAQSLVRASYINPLETFSTNVQGTANLLESLKYVNCLKVIVAITTDKVYKNHEHIFPYRETDELGGHDPYSASKSAAEIVISCFRDSFLNDMGIGVASARSGNVIGGGDWSQDRLIPDAIRSWIKGDPLEIRQPYATRPWQHVLEPILGYLKLAEKLWTSNSYSGAYNFGPMSHEVATVKEVVQMASYIFGNGKVIWGGSTGPHEAISLSLETAKAQHVLGVTPCWSLQEAVHRTINWYKKLQHGIDAYDLCMQDITEYENSHAKI